MSNKRTWNTPIRENWNPVIKECLNAIDYHVAFHIETGESWHEERAQILRKYVADLKEWIHLKEKE